MKKNKVPHFIIKENLQKSKQTGVYFKDIVTPDVLTDISFSITGSEKCTYTYVGNDYEDEFLQVGYNKGRMAIMHYEGIVHYISFSEKAIGGRNSSVQSVSTAFNLFFMNKKPEKKLYYYFLNAQGSVKTEYQMLIYRLMRTVGFEFLNDKNSIGINVEGFRSIDDIMYGRQINSGKNKSNNSTYITKTSTNEYEIYGKTYGANKYETSMICYALSLLAKPDMNVTLYEILEGNLAELPKPTLKVLKKMKVIKIVPTDMKLEKKMFENPSKLRSPKYIFNLLDKLGPKKCAMCDCEIPELIQGAHIYPVSAIKKNALLNIDEKVIHAIDGENGLWLCENHHSMYDKGLININNNGEIEYKENMNEKYVNFINETTTIKQISNEIFTDEFKAYLLLRNTAAL